MTSIRSMKAVLVVHLTKYRRIWKWVALSLLIFAFLQIGWFYLLNSRQSKLQNIQPIKPVEKVKTPDDEIVELMDKLNKTQMDIINIHKKEMNAIKEHLARKKNKTEIEAFFSRDYGVTVVGNLKGEFGIAETARSTAKALKEVKVPFSAFDFVCDKRHERGDKWFEQNKIRDSAYFKYKVFILEESPGCIHHFVKVIPEVEYKSQYKIIHTAWELDQLPDQLINDIKGLDEIWVASRYNVPIFAEHFPWHIEVIPDVIEADYFTEPDRELVGLPQDAFIFLTAFDFNSFILRKNPQAIINAFKKSFKPDDKSVMLLITTINSKHNKDDYDTISKMIKRYTNIKMTTDTKPKNYVTILKKSVDVFVTAYRSEGFGLNVFESMALGKAVIATNYSAPADFMTEENAYPIPYKLIHFEGQYSGLSKSSLAKARWADIDVDILASTMLHVKNNPIEAKLKGLKARQDIEKKLSAKAIGEKIRNRLDIIYNDILPKRSKKVIEIS